jgi:rhamnose transport system substrate-binding protein
VKSKLLIAATAVALLALTACAPTSESGGIVTDEEKSLLDCRMTMIPKNTDNPYFAAIAFGANEAAEELGGTEVNYTGTPQPDVRGQIQRVTTATQQGDCAVAIAGLDGEALAPSLDQAREAGATVVSFDADVEPDSRTLWIAQASNEDIGVAQFKSLAQQMDYSGEWAILSAQSTAANQNAWIDAALAEAEKPEYDEMTLVKTVYGDDIPQTAYDAATSLLQGYPDLGGIFAPTTIALQSAVKAKQDQGNTTLVVAGLGWPPSDGELLKSGAIPEFILWSPRAVGYLTYYATQALLTGEITGAEGETFEAGRMGEITIGVGGEVDAGVPIVYTADNVDEELEEFRTE